MEDAGAGIDEGNHVALGPAAERTGRVHAEIAAAAIADGADGRRQQKQRVHLLLVPGGGEPVKVGAGALDPERIGVEQEEGLGAEQRQGVGDAAAGFEQHGPLVGNDGLGRAAAPREMRLDQGRQVVDVDDGGLDAGRLEAVEGMVDQRAAGDLDQRFRHGGAQGPHALADPRGKHHRPFRSHGSGQGRPLR